MKDFREVLLIIFGCLFLVTLVTLFGAFGANTGDGQIASQMRLAQAHSEQVDALGKISAANLTNAQADEARARAESSRNTGFILNVMLCVAVFLLTAFGFMVFRRVFDK